MQLFLFCLLRFSVKLSLVIPLCLSTVVIWYSLCFCAPTRPCTFTSGPYLSAIAMKSRSHNLWPATKPFPQHQPDNKHEYLGAHHSGAVCSCAGACLHNFTFLCVCCLCSASCNPIQNFACTSTKNWQQTEIEHGSWSHIPTHSNLDFSITSKREFLTFFLSAAPLSLRARSRFFVSLEWPSPLSRFLTEREVIRVGCSHLKSCTCSTTCMNIKAWLSIFTCNLCIIGITKQN